MGEKHDGMLAAAQALGEALGDIGGAEQARKLLELYGKQLDGELAVAFCGHFSAGKSTLINRLCGRSLLPSGPIPTSANVVWIRNGPGEARLYRRQSGGSVEQEIVPVEQAAAACRDGAEVERVELYSPAELLGADTVLLDTPGIDSVDAAHQAATESAMHLADVVFYVMDYNYVQSEVNFVFARQLAEAGKHFYLLVNQIDKHQDRELTFAEFKAKVKHAFGSWGVKPAGYLFISNKETAAHNEWPELLRLIRSLQRDKGGLKAANMKATVLLLIQEALRYWREQRELEKTLFREALGEGSELQDVLAEEAGLAQRQSQLKHKAEAFEMQLKKELQSILDNATITPAATRELAAAYLAARKPGFRVGWLGSGSKTEEERKRRLGVFRRDLLEQAQVQLVWHLTDALKQRGQQAGVAAAEIEAAVDDIRLRMGEEQLAGLVQASPDITGEYVLNYCRMVAAELKKDCRRQSLEAVERLTEQVAGQAQREQAELAAQQQDLAVRMAAARGLVRLAEEEAAREAVLLQLAEPLLEQGEGGPVPGPATGSAAACARGGAAHQAQQASPPAPAPAPQEPAPWAGAPAVLQPPSAGHAAALAGHLLAQPPGRGQPNNPTGAPAAQAPALTHRLTATAARLTAAADALRGLPGAGHTVRTLADRANQLATRRFTVALFGAFSAGKSSFANALMGRRLLPVSPNPTTAAITTILPPTSASPAGTVRVRMKTEQAITEELAYSLQAVGMELPPAEREAPDAANLLQLAARLPSSDQGGAGKPHLAFLQAVSQGWTGLSPNLGQEILTGADEFADYTANEEKACLVESVTIFADTPLSERGVILVDTPGADSINARHTGVAFRYIKDADAIVFIIYYNHPFSQADREFLLQLGRVKDTMELDKMFFIVNAADLADSKEELDQVLSYIEANLLQYGIRSPRLFPVSSKLALNAKLNPDPTDYHLSGFAPFEQAFEAYAEEELAETAVLRAENELKRTLALLDSWIEAAQGGEEKRLQLLASLELAEQQALASARFVFPPSVRTAFAQELEEQLYYVKQRTYFRFPEFYRGAFHPAALREDAGDLRMAIKAAWQELRRQIGYHLSQEILAVTLRLEQFLFKHLYLQAQQQEEQLAHLLPGYQPAENKLHSFLTPQVDGSPADQEPELKWLLSFYRSGRQFFEGDGSSRLQHALQEWTQPAVDSYLREHTRRLSEDYQAQAESLLKQWGEQTTLVIRDHCAGLRQALTAGDDLSRLGAIRQELANLLHNN